MTDVRLDLLFFLQCITLASGTRGVAVPIDNGGRSIVAPCAFDGKSNF